jgi:hypothetical protein
MIKNKMIFVLVVGTIALSLSGCMDTKASYLGEYHDSKGKYNITLLKDNTFILDPPSGLTQKGTYTVDEETHTITMVSALGIAAKVIYETGKFTDEDGEVWTKTT